MVGVRARAAIVLPVALLGLACGDDVATAGTATTTGPTTRPTTTGVSATTVGPTGTDATETSDASATTSSDSSVPDFSPPPHRPPLPVDRVTVTLSTASELEPIVDGAALELCLSNTLCFEMRRPDRDDAGKREAGPYQYDVHTFEELDIDPDEIAKFELRATGSSEPWTPRCLSVRLDGEPVHCTRTFAEPADPLNPTWSSSSDDEGDCTSCFEIGEVTDLRVTHGPMVGARDAAAGEARVWLRADATREVVLFLADNPEMDGARAAAAAYTESWDDFTAELLVEDLLPGATYYYQLLADDEFHDAGLPWAPGGVYPLTMPPADGDASVFTFALGSCARMFRHGNYDAVAGHDPEFLLLVGDYHYGDVLQYHHVDNEGQDYDKDVVALNDMRWWYRTAHWEKSELFAGVPIVSTWDDHDYGGGELYADEDAAGKDHSRRAMLEYFANPPRDAMPNDEATYFRFTHGDAEFFVLDARWHRPRLCSTENGGEPCDPGDPLGPLQTEWLLDGLASSSATFKFIAAGTRWYGGGPKAWSPFLDERDALLEAIVAADVHGVVLLSGGPHVSELRTFDAAGRTWYEVISSPLSSGVGTCSGQAVSCYDAKKNFVALEVDTEAQDPEVRLQIVTFDGVEPWDAPPIVLSNL